MDPQCCLFTHLLWGESNKIPLLKCVYGAFSAPQGRLNLIGPLRGCRIVGKRCLTPPAGILQNRCGWRGFLLEQVKAVSWTVRPEPGAMGAEGMRSGRSTGRRLRTNTGKSGAPAREK